MRMRARLRVARTEDWMREAPELVAGPEPAIYGPDPIELGGCHGSRYWVHAPFPFTGKPDADERLSGYPVALFQPPARDPQLTPLLVGLQGMAAPYLWTGFLVPTLLDMGIACLFFDTPGAGERSLARTYDGDVLAELQALAEWQVPISAGFVVRLFEAVARDFRIVLRLARER